MIKVFITGPYTNGDVAQNVKNAMDMANRLIELGFAPFCPHLTHFLHMNNWQPYEKWIMIDKAFLKCCDAIIILQTDIPSKGSKEEVSYATELGIPVFREESLSQMIEFFSSEAK